MATSPSLVTVKVSRRGRRGGSTRFTSAAKACKGTGKGFRACMKRKLSGR